jgi:pimeloyl-ACP methyl ester carboxylesterase
MNERFCTVGDVELCYETFGDPDDPALLLIMGLGTQMIGWHHELCGAFARRGFHVIRFDNRDIGRSTHFDSARPPTRSELLTRRFRRLAYTLSDMADDATGLLDQLGIGFAHVVGASMGGMIAQTAAARHPERVLSLVSIMSNTGSRWSGQPAPRVYPFFLRRPATDRDSQLDRVVSLFRLVGSEALGFDEEELRSMARLSIERGGSGVAGTARQLAAILAAGNRTATLRRIEVPTLVIHGTADRLVRPSGGRATARAIPGARLMMIEGMGHDLPRAAWSRLVGAIADHAAAARHGPSGAASRAPASEAPR